jgi:anti-sigma factor RsiW
VRLWFLERVDFSPPVPDLSPAGFSLADGCLDYLTDRPVAAVVYRRRDHLIDVFTWPAADGAEDAPVRSPHRHGFQILSWRRSSMACWAILDLNAQELD